MYGKYKVTGYYGTVTLQISNENGDKRENECGAQKGQNINPSAHWNREMTPQRKPGKVFCE